MNTVTGNLIFFVSIAVFVVMFFLVVFVQVAVKTKIKRYKGYDKNIQDFTYAPFRGAMGKPLLFVKFIITGYYKKLNDNSVTFYCNVLRFLYIFYLIIFLWICAAILLGLPG